MLPAGVAIGIAVAVAEPSPAPDRAVPSPVLEPAARPSAPTSKPVSKPLGDSPAAFIELTFVGDIMFGRFRGDGYDGIDIARVDVFGQVRALLASDLAVANLETPLVRAVPEKSPWSSHMRFAAPPRAAELLRDAGIGAVSLANNHAHDMRRQGALETPAILAEHGVVALGAGQTEQPLFQIEKVELVGWTIGFIAATTIRNGPQRADIPELPYLRRRDIAAQLVPVVAAARSEVDLIIVLMHWGLEYKDAPAIQQVRAARAVIDAGADAFIAHHPHVLQGIERYKHGLIAYSLGNFLFDNSRDPIRQSGVLRLRYQRDGRCLARAVFHPTFVRSWPSHHARRPNKWLAGQIRQRIARLSRAKPLVTEWREEGNDLVLTAPICPGQPQPTGTP
ncbi:MAG: CapA family protein [Myxococcota bacterium]